MAQALKLAQNAMDQDEVPVGAVIVRDNNIIAMGQNSPIKSKDATAHAEINAIREAGKLLGNYRLNNSTLYVTLEPCIMCAGAILQARIKRVVFGSFDPRFGAAGSQLNLLDSVFMNHRCNIESGVLATESQHMLSQFFQDKRN